MAKEEKEYIDKVLDKLLGNTGGFWGAVEKAYSDKEGDLRE